MFSLFLEDVLGFGFLELGLADLKPPGLALFGLVLDTPPLVGLPLAGRALPGLALLFLFSFTCTRSSSQQLTLIEVPLS